MALEQQELLLKSGSDIFPKPERVIAEKINTETFAQASAAAELPLLTPLAYTGTGWKVFAHLTGAYAAGTTETITGFVYPMKVTVSNTGEVLGNVMVAGEVDVNDIPVPSGQTSTNLLAALRKINVKLRDLYINNLESREG